ncbi:MAG: MoxR family ATPase [Dehalococcoidia bacterium]|nr:MAG: MoxR family ATPase [Dehalococcoidia bacterium]
MSELAELGRRIIAETDKAVVGKQELKRLLLVGMLCGGHVLIEGLAGTGKTTTARVFSKVIGGVFKRIQFTPDMLPSDVTGFNLYRTDGEMRFVEGPVFANVVLADELNRTTVRTQSALLEAMQEGQATIEGVTHLLPEPFMVIASQLPYGGPGTYPLSYVQADRFMLYSWSGLPSVDDERRIIGEIDGIEHSLIGALVGPDDIMRLRLKVADVHVAEPVVWYMKSLVDWLRKNENVREPLSSRVGIGLFKSSRAFACLEGMDYVLPDHVKYMFSHVVYHRLVLTDEAEESGVKREDLVSAALNEVPVPREPV